MTTAPKYQTQNRIGIPALWVFTRLSQLLWLIITVRAIYDARGESDFVEKLFYYGALFFALSLVLHTLADGWVDANGMHFRRFFRYTTRRWDEIEKIQWVGSRLRVTVRGKSFLNRTVAFWLDPLEAAKQYRIQKTGGEPEPPAILVRIAALPLDSPPQIVQGPLKSPTISLAFFAGFSGAFLIALVGLLYRIVQGR